MRDDYSMPKHLTKRSPSPRGGSPRRSEFGGGGDDRLSDANKGHQMLQKMGWRGAGLGSQESGIVDPVSGGETRDKMDQFHGVGVQGDPFDSFRKQRAGAFYTRMINKAEERKEKKRHDDDD